MPRRRIPDQDTGITSVVIDQDVLDPVLLPDESAIWAVTLAELPAGRHATGDEGERGRRQDRLQWAAATWDPPPLRRRRCPSVWVDLRRDQIGGRFSRVRLADLLIASTAAANGLPLYTRNPSDFVALEGIVSVVGL